MKTTEPHRHNWNTGPYRDHRTCRVCGQYQRKVSGRWTIRNREADRIEAAR